MLIQGVQTTGLTKECKKVCKEPQKSTKESKSGVALCVYKGPFGYPNMFEYYAKSKIPNESRKKKFSIFLLKHNYKEGLIKFTAVKLHNEHGYKKVNLKCLSPMAAHSKYMLITNTAGYIEHIFMSNMTSLKTIFDCLNFTTHINNREIKVRKKQKNNCTVSGNRTHNLHMKLWW